MGAAPVVHYNAKAIAAARTNNGQSVIWAPVALPVIGGSYVATARGGDSVVAFSTADTRVSGAGNQVITEVIVYDLSILGGLLTADEVRVKIRVENVPGPPGGNTNFFITGVSPAPPNTFYRNLVIDGVPFGPVVFDAGIANGIPAGPAAIQAYLNLPAVRAGRFQVLRGNSSFYSTLTTAGQPNIAGVPPNFASYNATFGVVHFGEWFVESNRQRVTLLRIELNAGGQIVIGDPDPEEYPYP